MSNNTHCCCCDLQNAFTYHVLHNAPLPGCVSCSVLYEISWTELDGGFAEQSWGCVEHGIAPCFLCVTSFHGTRIFSGFSGLYNLWGTVGRKCQRSCYRTYINYWKGHAENSFGPLRDMNCWCSCVCAAIKSFMHSSQMVQRANLAAISPSEII